MTSPAPPAPDAGDDQDRSDMARLCAGHDAALNDLMQRHAPRMFHYLLRSLQNEEDAGDLAQETFARVYHSRDKFDSKQRFSVWLYAIASNLVRTEFRFRKRHPTVPLETLAGDPSFHLAHSSSPDVSTPSRTDAFTQGIPDPREAMQAAEMADSVRHAIAQLPEELRRPLILSEYEELSHSEIGAILNCSSKAIETRLYRARKHLRSRLSRFLD